MKRLIVAIMCACLALSAYSQQYSWKCYEVDGSRTGCKSPSKDNVDETVGVFAKGKYIYFLDGDDFFSKNTLSNVYDFFELNENSVDVVSLPLYYFQRI